MSKATIAQMKEEAVRRMRLLHKIADKEFTQEDFSCEHLLGEGITPDHVDENPFDIMDSVINCLNYSRNKYLESKDKIWWWQMIQLLPTSYNQRRTVMLNYEVLANIYKSRRNHKLDEWHTFCEWITGLPYSELITGAKCVNEKCSSDNQADDTEVDRWAKREIELACAQERAGCENEHDASYGIGCYESALKAYHCLAQDGHSGFSIQLTKGILNRLIDGKCLTPIEDTPDIWTEVSFGDDDDTTVIYQCKRMSSLFKHVRTNGEVTYRDVQRVQVIYDKINSLKDYTSYDGGDTFKPSFRYPSSLDSSRLKICYAEEGGKEKDGLIELRRGVADISLGESNYAQVRIMVDGTHYLKGMAVYSDDLPDGVDVRFNTNKTQGTPLEKTLKPIKDDPSNPFGALIKEYGGQSEYVDTDGSTKLSLINKTREEADWTEWANRIPSQFLSKQSLDLAGKQLSAAKADKQAEYDEIMTLENPTVKKRLLQSFADDCDTASVHLYAAALPRQRYHVILPVPSMKDNEVYAPNYKNGETVALIRYPHGGTFEIPILKVNNNQPNARKMIGLTSSDAVGINSHVAERLSGADFDGDTVMVIPCNSPTSRVHINSSKPLEALTDFDAKMEYAERPGMTYIRRAMLRI